MNYTIKNEYITFVSSSFAAEQKSLILNSDPSVDYVWQCLPKMWNRNGPMCFPLLGDLPDNKYILNGKEYEMTIHGFAMDSEFTVAEHTDTSITYELVSTPETLKQYPYAFKLNVRYSVVGKTVNMEYIVSNPGKETMWYSVGGHPGFSCPLTPGENFEDCYIEFNKKEYIESVRQFHSPISVFEKYFGKEGTVIPLNYEIFLNGAIVFKGLNSDKVRIRSKKSDRFVEMDITGFPYFTLWTCKDQPFICLEPWHGVITQGDIPNQNYWKMRESMQTLAPGKSFRCNHPVTIG